MGSSLSPRRGLREKEMSPDWDSSPFASIWGEEKRREERERIERGGIK